MNEINVEILREWSLSIFPDVIQKRFTLKAGFWATVYDGASLWQPDQDANQLTMVIKAWAFHQSEKGWIRLYEQIKAGQNGQGFGDTEHGVMCVALTDSLAVLRALYAVAAEPEVTNANPIDCETRRRK